MKEEKHMTELHEQVTIAAYILNILKRVPRRSSLASSAAQWITTDGQDFIVGGDDGVAQDGIEKNIDAAIFGLERFIRKHRAIRPGVLQRNITLLQETLGLDDIETALVALAVRIKFSGPLMHFLGEVNHCISGDNLDLASMMLRYPKAVLRGRLQQDGKLCRAGIIGPLNSLFRSLDDILDLSPSLYSWVLRPTKKGEAPHHDLIGKPAKPSLLWDDFSYLGEARDFIGGILKNAVQQRSRGINILLYGPPGTGKTEFCKTLAHHAGLPLYIVAEAGRSGMEAMREDRLNSLRLANALLENKGNALLLFDEMEDLLSGMSVWDRQPGSKVFLSRLLEDNTLPTFWTTNDIDFFDNALLRRMTLALEIKSPPRQVRRKVWETILQKEKLSLPSEEIDRLANDFDDAPAIAGNAVKAARLAGGGTQQIRFTIGNTRKAMRRERAKPGNELAASGFNSAFTNTDVGLQVLTERLICPTVSKNFSLCLFGPPGTGKTAYTRYLANRMGLEVMHMRASDLTSKWVGDTERNIAAAFQKAREDEAFLIFDEADSFLHDRQYSQRSWEISQVNEMLTWMESHPLPFACTTNLMERLDAASLRRFTFKIGFRYLTRKQLGSCFQHFFNLPSPSGLESLDRLTPGDFSVVCRKATILGQDKNPTELLVMLRQEQEGKPGASPAIGFTAAIC